MKRMVIIFSVIQSLFFADVLAKEALKLNFNTGGEPWAWEENGTTQGILFDIADEALVKRMGIDVDYYFSPWKRAQLNVKYGITDALMTNYTESRKAYTVAGKELISDIKRSVFVKRDNPLIPEISRAKNIPELMKYRIGNYLGNGWAEKRFKGMDIVWAPDSTNILVMLLNHRFDVYIANPVSTGYKIKVLGYKKDLMMLPVSLEDVKASQYRLLIRKDSKYTKILPQFDETVRKMKESGLLEAIYEKYR